MSADRIYFDCESWSDFIGEDEKLFIGGLAAFDFGTIRNMTTTPTQNYQLYVKAMVMFHYMIEAWRWNTKNLGAITAKHAKSLQLLVQDEIDGKYQNPSESVVPQYILLLWHNFLQNIKHLELRWVFLKDGENGYLKFIRMFGNDDESELEIDPFLRILPNIGSVYIYNINDRFRDIAVYPLDSSLKERLLSAVKYLNEKRSPCQSINIKCPDQDIEGFIKDNNEEFKKENWYLVKEGFQSVFHRSYGPEPYTLRIIRMRD